MIITWKHLSEISSNIFAGGTPDTKREDFYGGDIPWLRSGEIDFNVIKSAEKNITQLGYENSSARWIKPKSVIMAMTGATVAKCATLEIESTANQSVCAIEPSEELNYKFLYYYLASKYVSIKGMAQGVLTSLNLQLIKRIEIPVPPIKEQKEIVVKLDVFTSLISKLDEEIELRKKQLESYLNTVFGANLKEAEERAAGNVLELKTLSELGTFTRGKRFVREDVVESGVPCIHYGDMYTY